MEILKKIAKGTYNYVIKPAAIATAWTAKEGYKLGTSVYQEELAHTNREAEELKAKIEKVRAKNAEARQYEQKRQITTQLFGLDPETTDYVGTIAPGVLEQLVRARFNSQNPTAQNTQTQPSPFELYVMQELQSIKQAYAQSQQNRGYNPNNPRYRNNRRNRP